MSVDSSLDEQLLHIRGFLERDLRPDTLWTAATSKKRHLEEMGCNTEASSSTNSVAIDSPESLSQSILPSSILRMSDIQNNAEFCLGPPRALMAVVPAARPFSKARSLPNALEYMGPAVPRVIQPKAKSGSSSSELARHGAQHF